MKQKLRINGKKGKLSLEIRKEQRRKRRLYKKKTI